MVPLTLCWFWQPKATKLDFNGVAWLLLGELLPDLPVCTVLSKPGVVHSWLVLPYVICLMIFFFRNGLLHVSKLERYRSVAKGTCGQQQRWSRVTHSPRIVALQRELGAQQQHCWSRLTWIVATTWVLRLLANRLPANQLRSEKVYMAPFFFFCTIFTISFDTLSAVPSLSP